MPPTPGVNLPAPAVAPPSQPVPTQTAVPAQPVQAQITQARRGEPITLNFANAEIEAVARTMATITGRNVVVDPRVKGVMTLVTERPVTPAVAYNQFLATLRMQGFTVVDAAGLDEVVPEADAKLQGGAVSVGEAPAGNVGNQIVTQIFRLNYESANNLVPVLRPLINPNNTINVNPGNNSLVITDYADNLRRMGRIIAALDVSNATDIEIIPLQHAIAIDLAPLVLRLIETSGTAAAPGAQGDASFKTTLENALIEEGDLRKKAIRGLAMKVRKDPTYGEDVVKKMYRILPISETQPYYIQEAGAKGMIRAEIDDTRNGWAREWLYYGNDPAPEAIDVMSNKMECEIWALWILDQKFRMLERKPWDPAPVTFPVGSR